MGKHLYEYTSRDKRDWRRLNNLMPFSAIPYPSEEAERDSETYELAVRNGIVRQRPGISYEYQIAVYPDGADIIKAGKEALESPDKEKAADALKKLRTFMADRQPERFFAVPNDGAAGNEEKVRKDHVLASMVMMDQIREELKKNADLENLCESIGKKLAAMDG